MNDDSSSEQGASLPDDSRGPAEIEPASSSERPAGNGFRIAPGFDPANVRAFHETAQLARKQIIDHIASLRVAGDQLKELYQGIAQAAIPLQTMRWDASGVVEQLREAARIKTSLPRYDFGVDLGRILDANRARWMESIRALARAVEDLIPENLRSLPPEDLQKVFQVNDEDGTSLAWAPRASIVDELLLAADAPARGDLFVEHASAIADDIDASLASVTLPEHLELRSMLMEVTAALRAGLYRPAQAAAAAAFDTVVNVHMLKHLEYSGRNSKTQTRNHFHPIEVTEWDEASFADLELVLVGAGISTAFEWWSRGTGCESFNRNGSAHHADDGAYSPAHAVRAALIAHAALRWVDEAVDGERLLEDAA